MSLPFNLEVSDGRETVLPARVGICVDLRLAACAVQGSLHLGEMLPVMGGIAQRSLTHLDVAAPTVPDERFWQ